MFRASRVINGGLGLAGAALSAHFLTRKQEQGSLLNAQCALRNTNDNSAFVFIKNKANTPETQKLVRETFAKRGITIDKEGEMTGKEIDSKMYIDQHYYAIASKATILPPEQLPVPNDKFEDKFGLSWNDALKSGSVFNALQACKALGITPEELDAAWGKAAKAKKLVKLGGGFYCGLIDTFPGKKPMYVFNGFFMKMRSGFVDPTTSIHYYAVSFPSSKLSWADFRGKVLGPTNPADAPADSLRGIIFKEWKTLGLASEPTTGDNGVHASASPFEGLAERMNWLQADVASDVFGRQLLAAGLDEATIKAWSVDPQVKGKSIFDQLEDMDAPECLNRAVGLHKK